MAVRDYPGLGIVVHWDSARCMHSERCTRGLPEVFDRAARPWVRVEAASADEIARVIDTCPSGALSYTRTDGKGAPGADADERGLEIATITPQLNGPLSIRGRIALTNPDGTAELVADATLCRCGHSSSKPFCDGSHEVVGFRAPGVDAAHSP
jgi:uncharacterized Fe-S cluster protein YjdI/CDGSH-type Zn-finger protein